MQQPQEHVRTKSDFKVPLRALAFLFNTADPVRTLTRKRRVPMNAGIRDGPLKIRIYKDGTLTLNGGKASPEGLGQPLEEAARKGRDVWVYIERPDVDKDPLFQKV